MEILYIEDDLIDQLIFKRILKQKKEINGKVANSLQEATQLVETHAFDIVLSDYYLAPDTIEDTLLKFSSLPIFLISGADHPQKIEQLYEKGLQGHFQKPFTLGYLQQIIDKKQLKCSKKASNKIADFTLPITFNFEFLDKISAKSPGVKKEFIQIFVNMGATDALELANAFHTQNWQMVRHFTHKFKSNFNMMGFKQLYLKAGELEGAFLQPNYEPILIRELPNFLDRLTSAISLAKDYLKS